MNNEQTIEKLKQMRLGAMAQLHLQHIRDNRIGNITADEYLALLTDHQWEDRQNRKIGRLLKQAGFKQQATLADINYAQNRNLDKNMFLRLGALDFVTRKENIILTGGLRGGQELSGAGTGTPGLYDGTQNDIRQYGQDP